MGKYWDDWNRINKQRAAGYTDDRVWQSLQDDINNQIYLVSKVIEASDGAQAAQSFIDKVNRLSVDGRAASVDNFVTVSGVVSKNGQINADASIAARPKYQAPSAPMGPPAPAGYVNGQPAKQVFAQPMGGTPRSTTSGGGVTFKGGSAPSAAPAPPSREEMRANAAKYFGANATFLDIPEVGDILYKSIEQNYTPEQLTAELTNTTWWKTTTERQRAFDVDLKMNPKTAATNVTATDNRIKQILLEAGITLDWESTHQIAYDWTRDGEGDEANLRERLVAESQKEPAAFEQIKNSWAATAMKKAASDYGLPMNETLLQQQAAKVALGTDNLQSYTLQLKEQAKGLYVGIAKQLDEGKTVREVANPLLSAAGNLLETPDLAETADLTDPKWSKFLSGGVDLDGKPAMMGMSKILETVRGDKTYGWNYTKNAEDTTRNDMEQLAKLYGKVAS